MKSITLQHIFLFALLCIVSLDTASAASLYHAHFANVDGFNATGKVTIKSSLSEGGARTMNINIKIDDLLPAPGRIYEVWAVDNETQHYNSLGKFQTNRVGRGSFNYQIKDVKFDVYDSILITQEPVIDFDPHPSLHVMTVGIPSSLYVIKMKATLRGLYQVPRVITPARGAGTFLVDTQHNTLQYDIIYTDLEEDETGAHIHGFADKKNNAPVMFSLPLGEHKVGVLNYPEDAEDEILSGMTYVNVHSSEYPEGEIRGQIELVH